MKRLDLYLLREMRGLDVPIAAEIRDGPGDFEQAVVGGGVTAPNLAIWTEDGWVVDNEGVPPDIEVEQTPAEVIQGHRGKTVPPLRKARSSFLYELYNTAKHRRNSSSKRRRSACRRPYNTAS